VERCARLRLDSAGALHDPAFAAKAMLHRLSRRIHALDAEIAEADTELAALTEAIAPTLLAVFGVGPAAAGQLLTTAGENPTRLHSEAALARLCGVAPIPASSGNNHPPSAAPRR